MAKRWSRNRIGIGETRGAFSKDNEKVLASDVNIDRRNICEYKKKIVVHEEWEVAWNLV